MMFIRRIDRTLSEGHGRQLLWLLVITLLCIICAIGISRFLFNDNVLSWQDVVGLFLDPGVFGSFANKGHDIFRLVIALLSVFLFSALLVSVFTNVFENITVSVREGKRRYSLKNHILILGGGHHLKGIINQYNGLGETIVVLSETKPTMDSNIIYYNGRRDSYKELKSACVTKAKTIYIIGEDHEEGHDATNLRCMDAVKELCSSSDKDIHCYITINEQVSSEVFQYLKQNETGHLLLVDVINDYEFAAEQLLVNTDFLPVIKQGDDFASHLIILGTGKVSQAIAYTAAHISHYPSSKKTKITFIGENMRRWMDDLVVARPGLFELCSYNYISSDGACENHTPDVSFGDFIDVEWEFIDSYESSALSQTYIINSLVNTNELVTLYICHEETSVATSSALHLPRIAYEKAYNIAIYLNSSTDLINRANATGMFGKITIFGIDGSDRASSLIMRSLYGKRVNFIYDRAYCNPPSVDEEEAWYKIPEAHKYSSIYCANAMFLRRQCFDMNGDRLSIYEAEHRRWMMSELLMGFRTGEKTDKKRFVHADIVPFYELPKEEQEKDKILIDAMDYILG